MKSSFRKHKLAKFKENPSSWRLVYDWFKPAQEGLREALTTLGNGYFGARGAAPESAASRIHYPGTYIAGVYNKLPTRIAGRIIHNDDMVNCPNWLYLSFRPGKFEWVSPNTSKILYYRQELGMRRGILSRRVIYRDRDNRKTLVETQRIVHMADPHRAVIRYTITPENYEGWVVIRSALDGSIENSGVARYRQLNPKHLKPVTIGTFGRNCAYLSMKTNESGIQIAQAARTSIFHNGKELKPAGRIVTKDKKVICQDFGVFMRRRQQYEVEKTVAIYTSHDKGVRNPLAAAVRSVKRAPSFEALFRTHRNAWDKIWNDFDIEVEGDAFAQKILRLHTFHIIQTASGHNKNIDAGLPARGLHGEAYRGHVFWDELFVMPFFDFRSPDISKALLLYRYRRLNHARKYARENGYKGAMFPWQSSSLGDEQTQVIHLNPMSGKWDADLSRNQRHISFSVAYNVWKYWERTADTEFLSRYGAEIILSVAKFGASLARYDNRDGRYHTEGLVGPDEFHEKMPGQGKPGFRDNAYTNMLIVWTLMRARDVLDIIPKAEKARLIREIGIDQAEVHKWHDITRKMNIIINQDGIISQFDGYFKLQELDWEAYREKYGNIQRMDRILKSEGKHPNAYKVSKQADALMLFYLFSLEEVKGLFHMLGYRFDKYMLRKNYEYYVKRTSHGSTLSKVVHCHVSHLLGRTAESWNWFNEVLKSDIYDTQGGTTQEGVHMGVMGGSVNIVMKAFAGIHVEDNMVRIRPSLPKAWRGLRLKFRYKGVYMSLDISMSRIIIAAEPRTKSFTFPVEVEGRVYYIRPGMSREIPLKKEEHL